LVGEYLRSISNEVGIRRIAKKVKRNLVIAVSGNGVVA